MEITVGCDPEVFLTKAGNVIPSCDLVGGTKKRPKKISSSTWIQEDNVLVEFNISPAKYEPAGNVLFTAATAGLSDVKEYLASLDKEYGVDIRAESCFSAAELSANKKATQFGCEPFKDAYKAGADVVMNNDIMRNDRWRGAGGHIHFGYDVDKVNIPKWALVCVCDLALAKHVIANDVPSSIVGANRRMTYGAPGSYRDKPYGFEYRTPSCVWLRDKSASAMAEDICAAVHWSVNNPQKLQHFFKDKFDRATFLSYFRACLGSSSRGYASSYIKVVNKTIAEFYDMVAIK